MWTCSKCEQENSDNLSKCILCETGKPQLQTSENNNFQQTSKPIQPGLIKLQPEQQENRSNLAHDPKRVTSENTQLKRNASQDQKEQYNNECKAEGTDEESFGFWLSLGLGAVVSLIALILFYL